MGFLFFGGNPPPPPPSPPPAPSPHLLHLIIISIIHIIISLSSHRIISSSHHLTISSSHHLTISSSHLISSHHLIIPCTTFHDHCSMITFAPVCVAGASRKGRGAPGRCWPAAPLCVAGAVFRASRKGCGAPGRRGPRLLSAWQAQYLEPPEKGLARLVAVGRGFCLRGRRNTWSLQKGLRRAWSPWAAAPVCVAGAVLGASRKSCGAPGRRGPRLLFAWQAQYFGAYSLELLERQAQYLELLERVAARLVAVGRGSCLRGRRSTWSL